MPEMEEYTDRIMAEFQDRRRLDASKLEELLAEERAKSQEQGRRGDGQEWQEEVLKQCEEALRLYTDLLKLKLILRKMWDLQMLDKSVQVRFGLQSDAGDWDQVEMARSTEEVYKDVALKTIAKCDKLSKALEELTGSSNRMLQTLQRHVRGRVSDFYKHDSVCLLLELWFVCGEMLRELKASVASFFMKAKLLLIDYELECVQLAITSHGKTEQYQALSETIKSYKSFMQVLLQQLRDAETTSDSTLFEECLGVFLEIEGMYQSLNMDWLLMENRLLQQDIGSIEQQPFAKEDHRVMQNIDYIVDELVHNDGSHESDTTIASNQFDVGEETEVYKSRIHSLSPEEKLQQVPMSRRFSEDSELSLNMEHTSISRELPVLLKAFNNAKRLEMELESVRMSPDAIVGTPLSTPTSPFSDNLLSSTPKLQSIGKQTSPGILSPEFIPYSPLTKDNIIRGSRNKNINISPGIAGLGSSALLSVIGTGTADSKGRDGKVLGTAQLRQDMTKFMNSGNKMHYMSQKRPIQGFGSSILNNLYGIGAKK